MILQLRTEEMRQVFRCVKHNIDFTQGELFLKVLVVSAQPFLILKNRTVAKKICFFVIYNGFLFLL
jgi:hypothetical protein